jgi:small-conductance mechanosensitive channel
LAALLLFCASVWALWQIMRWLGRRLETSFHRLEAARSARGAHLLMWERARVLVVMALKFVVVLVLISEFSFMASYVLGLFPQTSGISTTLLGYLQHTFGRVGTAIVNYLPSGGVVIIAVLITHYVLRILKFVADAVESGDLTVRSLHPEMVKPTYQLIRVVVLLFALVVVFPYLPGGKSEAFKGVSLFLGLLLSLGSSSAVSNVLAGLFLTYMRPFRAGDRVKIADSVGDVLEKTLLVTRLRTIKNVEVVIPNTAILNNPISNYSALARSSGLILNTSVTIGYDAPWRRIHELLIRAALDTDGILADPAPFVLETALNDSYVTYELNGYTNRPNDIQNIYSHLHELIQDTFNDAGVEIMSPTFYALRDGNTVTLPESHRPEGYEAPAFRVKEAAARPEASSVAGGSGQLSR